MRAVRADFASAARPSPLAWLVAALLLGIAAWFSHGAWLAEQQLRQARDELAAQRQAAASRSLAEPHAPPPYERSAQQMLRERTARWPEALRIIEAADVPTVAITNLAFEADDGAIHVQVTAGSAVRLLDWIEAIGSDAGDAPGALRWSLVQVRRDDASGVLTAMVRGAAASGSR